MTSLTRACVLRRRLLFDYWMVAKRANKLVREKPFSKETSDTLELMGGLHSAAPEGSIKAAIARDLMRLAAKRGKVKVRKERKKS